MCDECWDKMVDYLDELTKVDTPDEVEDAEDIVETLVDSATITLTVSEYREQLDEVAAAAREEEQYRAWKAARQSTLNTERARINEGIGDILDGLEEGADVAELFRAILNIINDKEQ
jgi:outer membrane protein TolC